MEKKTKQNLLNLFLYSNNKLSYYSQTSRAGTSLGPWKFVQFEPLRFNHGARSGSKWQIWRNLFDLLHKNSLLSVLLRIALMRQFLLHTTYNFMIK